MVVGESGLASTVVRKHAQVLGNEWVENAISHLPSMEERFALEYHLKLLIAVKLTVETLIAVQECPSNAFVKWLSLLTIWCLIRIFVLFQGIFLNQTITS